MMQLRFVGWLGVAGLLSPSGAVAGQEVMQLDLKAGREVVGGPEYRFRASGAVDYDRRLVYAVEALEPLAVAAYSLDDGSTVRLYGGKRGEGPGELMNLRGVALGPGGVFVAGRGVVNHWALSGELLYQWRPVAPGVGTICSLAGQPAVAAQQGVVLRADDGRSIERWGATLRTAVRARPDDPEEAWVTYDRIRMACADSVVYVLTNHAIAAYSPSGVRQIPVPSEIEEIARQREAAREPGYPTGRYAGYSKMVTTADGRLLVTVQHREIAGAVVDPATGCYKLLKTDVTRNMRYALGLMADSLVFVDVVAELKTELVNGKRQAVTRNVSGRRVEVFSMNPRSIAIRPLRLVSEQPCIAGE